MSDIDRFIGKVISYDPQPYGERKVRIERITPKKVKRPYHPFDEFVCYDVYGTVVEGHERNRLFQHVSWRDISGTTTTIYGVGEQQLERGEVITALCG